MKCALVFVFVVIAQVWAACDHEDRKKHAIALLEEWVKHNHYNAVEKLYSDIYHHSVPTLRKRQWHHYQSTFDEAFIHGNTDPDYRHVEWYIKSYMNRDCQTEIMKWIEADLKQMANEKIKKKLAKVHHGHINTNIATTHAPPHTPKPTTTAAPTTTTAMPTEPPTTTPTPTLAPLNIKTACEAVTFVTALARGTILTNAGAGLCTDGTHSQPEALVLESCSAPKVSTWTQGVKVVDNCKRIPDYTPIGMFSFGTFVQDGSAVSGIITECTSNGFKIAIQLCGHPVNVYNLVSGAPDAKQNADNYYVINW